MQEVNRANEMITKKVAALELFKVHKKVQNLSILTIAGVFICVIVAILNKTAGALTASIFSAFAAYFFVQSRKAMMYYNEKYDLQILSKGN